MQNRFILILGILSLTFLVVIVSSNSFYHYHHSVNDQKEKEWLLAKTIAKSLDLPMLAGEMGRVQEMLIAVGKLENLRRVHITDDTGVIRYSSQPKLIGSMTGSDIIKQAIKDKKEVDRFETRGEDYLFSLALPILNEERCHSCHGSKKELLGVLRVGVDWIPIRKSLTRVLQRDVIVAVMFFMFLLIMAFLFQRLYNNAQQAYMHLQQAQEQLIKTEKMAAIGQMAAAISHDLRNPLTGIKMATYYLSSRIDRKQTEINNILKDIELEIDYASNVVTNILTYSRPTELIYARCNINKLVDDAMHFTYLQNKELNIELVKKYEKNIPEILIDNKQIKQVIINLISNSIQAMPDGGTLTVKTSRKNSDVELEIRDTGTGIGKEDINRVFTPFFTTKARGVGLGLAIVNNIIQKHGGHIDIQSAPGQGTSFKIILPIR